MIGVILVEKWVRSSGDEPTQPPLITSSSVTNPYTSYFFFLNNYHGILSLKHKI